MTMPSYFKSASYSTAFVGESHGNDRPFETQFENSTALEQEENGTNAAKDEKIAAAAIDGVKARSDGKPWFMWVGFASVSSPPDVPLKEEGSSGARSELIPSNFAAKAPAPYVLKEGREKAELAIEEAARRWETYSKRVRDLDRQIGRILKSVRDAGQMGNTIVVFASNNGVQLGSHGLVGNDNVYEETARVPLILSGKGFRAGVNESLVSLTDVLPTLIELTGGVVPLCVDGHSLRPLLSGQRERVRSSMFLTHRDQIRAMRDEQWKLIVHRGTGTMELYDLDADPLEMHDLSASAEHSDRISGMMVSMHQWQRAMGDFLELPKAKLAVLTTPSGGK
jgi:arylsulfatase A-like enzyme